LFWRNHILFIQKRKRENLFLNRQDITGGKMIIAGGAKIDLIAAIVKY
jgi:hypothetical protein